MKQSKGLNGDLKPDQKKTSNKTMMGPTTDIDSQMQPSETDWATLWNSLRTNPPSCKENGSKVIKHNWVNNHAFSLPQNIQIVTYLLVASDSLFELFRKISFSADYIFISFGIIEPIWVTFKIEYSLSWF